MGKEMSSEWLVDSHQDFSGVAGSLGMGRANMDVDGSGETVVKLVAVNGSGEGVDVDTDKMCKAAVEGVVCEDSMADATDDGKGAALVYL
jgi:hypothetical protein